MAFNKTPEQSTYQTKMIRLVRELNSRGTNTNKDEDYINLYPEMIKNRNTKENELYLVKRDGSTQFIASVASSSVRGLFFWEQQNQLFVAVSDDIYIYNATTGTLTTTLSTAFTTSTGHVGFCEFLYDNGDVKVVATDGTTLQTIDTAGTRVAGADADMPVHLPYPVFLDGYLFIIDAGTADLWNSNLNDPLAYTAGDFITAEMVPDRATFLAKLNNYIVVMGSQSIEYFWDAAIATGSPLQRNDTPIKLTGFLGGVATLGNKLFMVGSHNESQPDIFILEDFKMTAIGTEAIRRHLASITITGNHTIQAAIVSRAGHDLYVFNTGTACYAYDLESKIWSRWTWQASSNFALENAVNATTGGGFKTFFSLTGTSAIYTFSSALYQDNGTTFPCTLVTDNEEFDSYNQKTMHRLTIWADKPTSSATGTLYWSDDDYQTYNTGISVDLYQELPSVQRLGRFRRRAFKFTFTQNQPMRIKGFEVDINIGQH
jgi:hypothetical protein